MGLFLFNFILCVCVCTVIRREPHDKMLLRVRRLSNASSENVNSPRPPECTVNGDTIRLRVRCIHTVSRAICVARVAVKYLRHTDVITTERNSQYGRRAYYTLTSHD